jgi:hypothetical protein
MPGSMGEGGRRPDHPVAIGSARGQAQGQLAREALDATDLGAHEGAPIDRDVSGFVDLFAFWHYVLRTRQRSSTPPPSSVAPTATASHASKPVRGSVAAEDVPLVVEAAVVAVVAVVPAFVEDEVPDELDELATGADEPDELEPEDDGEGDWVVDVFVVPLSGSMYCWSPADGPPPAIAVAENVMARTATTRTQPSVTRMERTARVLQAASRPAPRPRMCSMTGGPQFVRLQDLLHDKDREAASRRLVLGCSPPRR